MKRKYASAIVYLMASNVGICDLRDFLTKPENGAKYEAIKKFRKTALSLRPKAKQWIDKPFYLSISIQAVVGEPGQQRAVIQNGLLAFKSESKVVTTPEELTQYALLVGKIIEGEQIWEDEDMKMFDLGNREYAAPII